MTTEEYRNLILNKIKSLDPRQYADDYINVISKINLNSDWETQNVIRDLYFNYCGDIPVPSEYQEEIQIEELEQLQEEPQEEKQTLWQKIKSKMGW